jgi:predicted metal-dependent phosphoesterase TrpH
LVIDLHLHTKVLSADSSLDPEDAIIEAKSIGLDGICLTEHNKAWELEDVQELSSKWDFLVLRGVEVDTVDGHILVFGLHREFEGIFHSAELRKWVDDVGAVMIGAHPLKGFRAFGVNDLQLSPEQASKRPIFRGVDAVEGFSGRSTDAENRLTQEAAEILHLRSTGGSDAHTAGDIGNCVTIFEHDVTSERDLIEELKAGRFHGAYFRRDEVGG